MSYLNVTNVSHSFGGRQILENVSFKLLRGEHVGLVGANGEGKSTFLNIVTGHVLPDEGKVEWPGKVTVGYLDQQSTLERALLSARFCVQPLTACTLWNSKCWSCTIKWAMLLPKSLIK